MILPCARARRPFGPAPPPARRRRTARCGRWTPPSCAPVRHPELNLGLQELDVTRFAGSQHTPCTAARFAASSAARFAASLTRVVSAASRARSSFLASRFESRRRSRAASQRRAFSQPPGRPRSCSVGMYPWRKCARAVLVGAGAAPSPRGRPETPERLLRSWAARASPRLHRGDSPGLSTSP